ncbi:MAG: DUF2721 domain-containing protein [Limisphaerales bacterium]
MLSMTNRLARVMDRARQFSDSLRRFPASDPERIRSQLAILIKRARLLRVAITLSALSALLAAMLVITLFFSALLQLDWVAITVILFSACLISLIVSLLYFLKDINRSLAALDLEVDFKNPGDP